MEQTSQDSPGREWPQTSLPQDIPKQHSTGSLKYTMRLSVFGRRLDCSSKHSQPQLLQTGMVVGYSQEIVNYGYVSSLRPANGASANSSAGNAAGVKESTDRGVGAV